MDVLTETVKRFLDIECGNGSGCGNGFGSGNGNGSGDGNGFGNGFGNGSGNGSGDGDGNAIKSINGMAVVNIDDVQTTITQVHGNVAKGYVMKRNVYLWPCYVVKGGGKFAHGETLHKARQALEEKLFEDMDTDERIARFSESFALGKPYPARLFFDWHNKLTGSCEMGRRNFAENRGIDVEHDTFTVEEFLQMTKDSYGGSVIRKTAEEMGVKL